MKKALLAEGAPLYFSPADLLPLAPPNGSAWKLCAYGRLVQKLQSFSQVFEYMHYIAPVDMIPAVSLCHSDYSPAESAAVQVKIIIKGMDFSEQAHHIYFLFSHLVNYYLFSLYLIFI